MYYTTANIKKNKLCRDSFCRESLELFHTVANDMAKNTRGSCQCESLVIYTLALKCEADTLGSKQTQPWWDLPSGFGCLVGFVCLLSLCVYVACVLCVHQCTCASLCESHNLCDLGSAMCVCVMEKVCALLCSRTVPPLFLHTCVMILWDFSPCCHISIPHWNILILSLVQQPCGYWANIDLHCHWTPASLRERQDVVLYCGQSQHKIKVEQTVKCMWGVWFAQMDYDSARQCAAWSDVL